MRFGCFVTMAQPGADMEFRTQYMTRKQYKLFNQELNLQYRADIQTVLNY